MKIDLNDGSAAWYMVESALADRAPAGLIPLLPGSPDAAHWTVVADDPLVAFAATRLAEDEAAAKANIGAGLGDAEDGQPGYPQYPTYLNGDVDAADEYIDRFRPLRVLREVAAKRAIIGSQTSDHAPVETMYGLCCRTCVDWQDAPLTDGGETEFGIAIPQQWPCKVARSAVAAWSGHPEYRKDEWAL